MNTILIPTDFSDTAKNAAHYAIAFAKQVQVKKIILLNVYQQPIDTTPTVADPLLETVEMYDINDFKNISEDGLKNFKQLLEAEAGDINLETTSAFNSLDEAIKEVCSTQAIDLVVMGITGGGGASELLIGSNTLSIAKQVQVPLLIVPANAVYKAVKEIGLALDFKKGLIANSITPLKKLLDETGAKLLVLHVSEPDKSKPNDIPATSTADDLLHEYHPEYKFLAGDNFMEVLNEFTETNQVDIIAAISKKHNWFENLFRRSHTKMMAFHSHIPLMILHE